MGVEDGEGVRVGLVFGQQSGDLVSDNARASPHIARRLARQLGPIRCSIDPEGMVGLSDSIGGAKGIIADLCDSAGGIGSVVGDCGRGCPGAILHLGKHYRNHNQKQDNQGCLYDWLSHKE